MATTNTNAAPAAASQRQPTLFLSHGGGPSFFMDVPESHPMRSMSATSESCAWFKNLVKSQNLKPKALLVFSAHWESRDDVVEINNNDKHTLYYDYGGFPAFTYKLEWNAPGEPVLAEKVAGLLQKAGFKTRFNSKRGLDHGVFIPLKLVFPNAEIPVVQVSLLPSLDPATHIKLGAAVQSLRDEGVLIIGSGFATHGFSAESSDNDAFMKWLTPTVTQRDSKQRNTDLVNLSTAPRVRQVHPRTEHLLPVHIAAGAAGDDVGTTIGNFPSPGFYLTNYRFG